VDLIPEPFTRQPGEAVKNSKKQLIQPKKHVKLNHSHQQIVLWTKSASDII
jgi:hypothetical protein